jgi:hypothetical protein|tara:strand:- start:1667 stop:1921 length:255 start_codon:yes stop_codon:yes gene_type:complete
MNKLSLLLSIFLVVILIWIGSNLLSSLSNLEEKVLFNNSMIREMYGILEKQDTIIRDIEDNLATWIERELGKIHSRLNNLPMEN